MDLGLRGRRAAVAAASAGLGLASAKALAADGVTVAICGRDRGRIDDAAAEVGEGCIPLVADVSDAAGGESFVTAAIEALGGLDILVTNAGGPPSGNMASTAVDAYPAAIDLNLMSVIGMVKAAVDPLREQGWGRIVAITSISVREPMAQLILSNTARAGVTGFLKTAARELAGTGVTVNSVQPGRHRTARARQVYGADADFEAMGDPDDFGGIVAFLCSEAAGYITGAALPVDGGAYAGLM